MHSYNRSLTARLCSTHRHGSNNNNNIVKAQFWIALVHSVMWSCVGAVTVVPSGGGCVGWQWWRLLPSCAVISKLAKGYLANRRFTSLCTHVKRWHLHLKLATRRLNTDTVRDSCSTYSQVHWECGSFGETNIVFSSNQRLRIDSPAINVMDWPLLHYSLLTDVENISVGDQLTLSSLA